MESRRAAAAFFKIIYDFMNIHTVDERRRMIDDYARNERTTWGVTRGARCLDTAPRRMDLLSPIKIQ